MKKIFAFISALLLTGFAFFMLRGAGDWYVSLLRKQGGFIKSEDILTYRYILPVIFSFAIGGFIFFLMKGGDE